jgi:hypothetical protein
MNVSSKDPSQAVSAWQLEFARLIAFPTEPPLFTDQHWWREVASEQPEDFVSIQKRLMREDRGSFHGAVLSFACLATRTPLRCQANRSQ